MTSSIKLRNRIFYALKPLIPRSFQLRLRQQLARRLVAAHANNWPIDEAAGKPPAHWQGWPLQKRFAFVLMHDVEFDAGQQRCGQLMRLEQALGFRSSFNFVPKRYNVLPEVRHLLTSNGFEVGVHGLYHDGKLFQSREIFQERAQEINRYLKEWDAAGFCSPASHHNLEWTHDLNVEYDSSTFDTDPFEPEPDGVQTIFPFWAPNAATQGGYVELPYTLPQDFTVFILLKEKTTELWRRKLDWIAEQGGMALLISHPDYMRFDDRSPSFQTYPVDNYLEFLQYVSTRYSNQYWHALPRDVARHCQQQTQRTQSPAWHDDRAAENIVL
jgi:hypothetical protein